MVAGLPGKNKLSKHGNWSGNGVAREHVIEVVCGYWYATTNVIGCAFFANFDDYQGELSPYIGPVDAQGRGMAQKRFIGIVRKIDRASLPGGGKPDLQPTADGVLYPHHGRVHGAGDTDGQPDHQGFCDRHPIVCEGVYLTCVVCVACVPKKSRYT